MRRGAIWVLPIRNDRVHSSFGEHTAYSSKIGPSSKDTLPSLEKREGPTGSGSISLDVHRFHLCDVVHRLDAIPVTT